MEFKTINESFESKLVINGHSLAINIPAYIIKKNNLKAGCSLSVNIKGSLLNLDSEVLMGINEMYKSIKVKKTFDFNDFVLYLLCQGSASEKGLSLKDYLSSKKYPKEYVDRFAEIENSLRDPK